MSQAASVFAQGQPPGNNGTIKIDGADIDLIHDNDPHPGCTFTVEFFGYEALAGLTATGTFELIPPTAGGSTAMTPVFVGADAAGGGTDHDGTSVTNLAALVAGVTPHPQQGFHVKLTIHAPGSIGADVKHKVFWIECAAAPPTTGGPTTGGPTTGGPTTGGPTTGGPTTGGPTTGGPTTGGPTTGGPTTGGPTTGGPTTGGPTTGGPTTGGPTTGGPTTGGPGGIGPAVTTTGGTTGAPPAVVPPAVGPVTAVPLQVLGQQQVAAPAQRREQPTRVLAGRLAVTGPVNLWTLWAAGSAFLALGLVMVKVGTTPAPASAAVRTTRPTRRRGSGWRLYEAGILPVSGLGASWIPPRSAPVVTWLRAGPRVRARAP